MTMRWEDTLTPALAEIRKRLAEGDHLVKVGLPDDPAVNHDGEKTSQTLGEIATINEFGSEDGHIPERPAFRVGLTHGAKDFNRLNRVNLRMIALGTKTIRQALEELGLMGAAKVKTEILDGDFAPNAPYTIAKKGSSHPLIDIGYMKSSITHEVVE